jgi:hypothetical protein
MGILIKNNIVNQKGNPAWYEDTLANRPTANLQGRMFVDTNNPSTGIYRDTGSSWVAVADPGAGTTGTLQQVTTNGNSTTTGITITTNGLGIGTTIPGSNKLDIHSSSGINATFNGTGTTNAALQLQNAGTGKWNITNNYNAGANDLIITDVLNNINRIQLTNAGSMVINSNINTGNNTITSYQFISSNTVSGNKQNFQVGDDTWLGDGNVNNTLFITGVQTPSTGFIRIGSDAESLGFDGTYFKYTGFLYSASFVGYGTAPSFNLVNTIGGTFSGFLGLATSVNNYINGSVAGDLCLVSNNTVNARLLLGVNGTSTSALCVSAANRILINSTTDSGTHQLQVTGSSLFNSYAKIKGVVVIGASGGYTTGDNTFINFGGETTPDTFGAINMPFGEKMKFNAYHGFEFKTSNSGSTPVLMFKISINGQTNITNTSTYASNALALAGGLVAGDIYKNSVGVLSIVY